MNAAAMDSISILITDSGLGGLSVCAEIVAQMERRRLFRNATLTYFNAWPEQDRGYNRLPGMDEKVRVFDQALLGMARFRPDLILIACNTLSALYPRTAFSRANLIRTIDIIQFGERMILEALRGQPDSQVILFGTPTTIEAGVHRARLIAEGVLDARIIAQPCDRLAGLIEGGPGCAEVRAMIHRYVGAAAALVRPGCPRILAALCCTHYGYSLNLFQEALARHFPGRFTVLDPNRAMGAELFPAQARPWGQGCRIDLKVVSRILWSEEKLAAIAAALAPVSALTAQALRDYRYDPALFTL